MWANLVNVNLITNINKKEPQDIARHKPYLRKSFVRTMHAYVLLLMDQWYFDGQFQQGDAKYMYGAWKVNHDPSQQLLSYILFNQL